MIAIHTETHRLRDPKTEFTGGQLVPPFETPARVDVILGAFRAAGLGEVRAPDAHGRAPVEAVHDPAYLAFLERAWEDWRAAGYEGEAYPNVWPSRRMPRAIPPREIEGRLGYYALAADCAICAGTWEAARGSADVALTGAALLNGGARAAFALCRPPGHHAAEDMYGGYCFLNNAAIAAQALRDAGAGRVAVLDVDFHHGNGTQSIFWRRGDVFVANLHGDPAEAFPHFLGGADETGAEAGAGANLNIPLPRGTDGATWLRALDRCLASIAGFGAEALVVSLGLDAYKDDPISFFALETADFAAAGLRIAGAGLPTLFVLEGGYAVEALGANCVAALSGFER